MTDLDAAPVEGTRLGRYLFLREIAAGALGPLYELRGEEEANGLNALGRVVYLSSELDADSEQAIVAAAWEALELRHEFTICVADVVFGTGWVTLVHDHAEGSLLRSLHQRAHERQSTFPVAVALRIVTDIIDGLQETRRLCESVGIVWSPGGTNAGSLYLCGDGRTRSLDGQLAVTLLRRDQAYARKTERLMSAPEVLSSDKQLDERTDVFAAGAVLWELLTGLELNRESKKPTIGSSRSPIPKLNLAVPNSVKFPIGLARAVDSALQSDPAKRPGTLAELKAAIAREGEVAGYAQVIDFTDALLHRESTLFRLTLDPTPRLSDELRANKTSPAHREWALQLAQRAQFAPKPAPISAATAVASRSLATGARPKAPALLTHADRATKPPRNVTQPPQPVRTTKFVSNVANRTLIGISATAAVTERDQVAVEGTAPPSPVALSPATNAEAISEIQPKAPPEPVAESGVVPAVEDPGESVVSAEDFIEDSVVRRKFVFQVTPVAIVIWSLAMVCLTTIGTLAVQHLLLRGVLAGSRPAAVAQPLAKVTTPAVTLADSTANRVVASATSAAPVSAPGAKVVPQSMPVNVATTATDVAVPLGPPTVAEPRAKTLARSVANTTLATPKPQVKHRKRRYVPRGL